jgi:hypothetical protein
MPGGREAAQIEPEFRDERLRRASADPRDRLQARDGLLCRGCRRPARRVQRFGGRREHLETAGDRVTVFGDEGVQRVDVGQLPRHQEALVGAEAPVEPPSRSASVDRMWPIMSIGLCANLGDDDPRICCTIAMMLGQGSAR